MTGVQVGRSAKVSGDEPGAGRELTGSQYMKAGNGPYPPKVGSSSTLRGEAVTGTLTGRSSKVTGDEPGSCRAITGDEYISQEQYAEFCAATPGPQDAKVGLTQTLKGQAVTGTLTGRSGKVTGDEPGTCKAITGTPYAGAEQYRSYCEPEETAQAVVREPHRRATPGAVLTGQRPGLGGALAGAVKGACETPTGTPYVGADQFAVACPATPAEPGSPDYPQPLEGGAPGAGFSISAPSHAQQVNKGQTGVTGTRYEQGHVTGPFGMASGKVTGTQEEVRFNGGAVEPASLPVTAELVGGQGPIARHRRRHGGGP